MKDEFEMLKTSSAADVLTENESMKVTIAECYSETLTMFTDAFAIEVVQFVFRQNKSRRKSMLEKNAWFSYSIIQSYFTEETVLD
jgi:hypothetical protein